MAVCCECGNESLGSIKCGEFLDWFLKKDPTPWSKQAGLVVHKANNDWGYGFDV